ncbi:TPA: hypothetical protein QB310_002096 [Pasteurella multocida]|nr:hypothetical protein [Pasteurella multocida]
MKNVKFKYTFFDGNSWFPTKDEEEVLRILYNQPPLEDTFEQKGRSIREIEENIEKEKQQAYEKWQSYDESDPFHHQIFPTETKAYARQQAEKEIKALTELFEWLFDADSLGDELLEWHEVYQRKFDLIN